MENDAYLKLFAKSTGGYGAGDIYTKSATRAIAWEGEGDAQDDGKALDLAMGRSGPPSPEEQSLMCTFFVEGETLPAAAYVGQDGLVTLRDGVEYSAQVVKLVALDAQIVLKYGRPSNQ